MKPLMAHCRVPLAGVLLAGLSLPALADSLPPEGPKTSAFGSGWVNGEVVSLPAPTLPAPLPYGAGYEQRHSRSSTATWPLPTPGGTPGLDATTGGRSGQGAGSGGSGGGRGR